MRILVVFYSFTGTVERLARVLAEELGSEGEVTLARIVPRRRHGYWGWLWRSFLPRARVAIEPTEVRLEGYDLVCLGFPKWTLACAPLNGYLARSQGWEGRPVALFMACGGFDEVRYLAALERRVRRRGAHVRATLIIRRRQMAQEEWRAALGAFCRQIRASLRLQGSVPPC